MKKGPVLILGAFSDIGIAVAHGFASKGHPIQLSSRKAETRQDDSNNIELRFGVKATLHEFDALATDTHAYFVDQLLELPEIVICTVGYMGNQVESECSTDKATLVIRSNFEGPANILAEFANRFEKRGSGTIVGISSIAGERGRATNYVYGSAKSGFTAFLSGLRNRLSSKGVHVITILPGFVATKMTEKMNLPKFLVSRPKEMADIIINSVYKKKDIAYSMPIWIIIKMIVNFIPERFFKKLTL